MTTEAKILEHAVSFEKISPLCTHENIEKWKNICLEETFVDPKIYQYIVRLIHAFRQQVGTKFTHGISTRSALALAATSKVLARIKGRNFVIPEDIKYLLPLIISHRIRLSFGAISQGETVEKSIKEVLDSVPVEYDQTS